MPLRSVDFPSTFNGAQKETRDALFSTELGEGPLGDEYGGYYQLDEGTKPLVAPRNMSQTVGLVSLPTRDAFFLRF